MPRRARKARRLLVGEETYLWSVGHSHRVVEGGGYQGCAESLTMRRHGARGSLRVTFAVGPGRYVPDGISMPSGAVATDEASLNLYEPGTARAVLDAALAAGWDPDAPPRLLLDGWTLFPTVTACRAAPPEG